MIPREFTYERPETLTTQNPNEQVAQAQLKALTGLSEDPIEFSSDIFELLMSEAGYLPSDNDPSTPVSGGGGDPVNNSLNGYAAGEPGEIQYCGADHRLAATQAFRRDLSFPARLYLGDDDAEGEFSVYGKFGGYYIGPIAAFNNSHFIFRTDETDNFLEIAAPFYNSGTDPGADVRIVPGRNADTDSNGRIAFVHPENVRRQSFDLDTLTNHRLVAFQDKDGTFAYLDDLTALQSAIETLLLDYATDIELATAITDLATELAVHVVALDADYNLGDDDLSEYFITNEGATALATYSLPEAVAGLTYTFIVQDADGIKVQAATGDTIRLAGSVSASGGYADSTTIGSVLTLLAINDTEWIATASLGSWSVT